MRISQARPDDVGGLARLLWLDTLHEEPPRLSVDTFTAELAQWWAARQDSHLAFIARLHRPEIVGMAWVALVPRVPRPGATSRLSADIQSVFVIPDQRGQGIGSALVEAASAHAAHLGSLRVTVQSGRKAVPVYERLGFESSRQLLQRSPPGPAGQWHTASPPTINPNDYRNHARTG
ncbi:GNAT family N-acetyltransferase [Micromonospora azadirachtae]|uniref:GNAT family N-acetyltransferase n=1 Tax=Micromonospora azadirachtae TaxID=1970735 RepID=A0ABW2ZX78_9ACTN